MIIISPIWYIENELSLSHGIDAGSVRLCVRHDGVKVIDVTITCQRPHVARALRGRLANEAATLIPLIYALCGRAQGTAASLAVAAARGVEVMPELNPLVQREVMREHLWRWLLDLPVLLGNASLHKEFSNAIRALDAGQMDHLAALLGAPEILALTTAIETIAQPPLATTSCLQVESAKASLAVWPLLTDELCLLPRWKGQPAETGAYSRSGTQITKSAGAFSARWRARLTEIENWVAGGAIVGAGGTASAVPVSPGIGRSLVETARGLLMHEVTLDGDRIADYRIVAPTEWNCHPDGLLPTWLMDRPSADETALKVYAAHAVAALDPCVRWELQLALEPTR